MHLENYAVHVVKCSERCVVQIPKFNAGVENHAVNIRSSLIISYALLSFSSSFPGKCNPTAAESKALTFCEDHG